MTLYALFALSGLAGLALGVFGTPRTAPINSEQYKKETVLIEAAVNGTMKVE